MMSTWTGSITYYKKMILSGGKHILWSLINMDKVGETDTTEEVITKEKIFKAILFLIRADESRYKNYLKVWGNHIFWEDMNTPKQ